MNPISIKKPIRTYVNPRKVVAQPAAKRKIDPDDNLLKREQLTTKKAIELLLNGKLKGNVCRYCLNIAFPLSELDQILRVGGRGAVFSVTIRDMVASFHPFKVTEDPNLPSKICESCLNQAIRTYLFAQQCEQSERAIRNCFDDIFDKVRKLDPLEPSKKRGRQKLHPNHNVIHTEHRKVIDFADPIVNLINSGSISLTKESPMTNLECKKCWQVLPNVDSLVNHQKIHPKTMWYHCRVCGRAFVKLYHLKKHLGAHKKDKKMVLPVNDKFECKQCYHVSENHLLHFQHIEKHKFQMVLEHLVERKMDELCTVCLDKGKLEDIDKIVCLHGGYPELTGNRTLYNILGSTVPEMNVPQNYTGTKICDKCLDKAITSYVFINRIHYIRNRLDTCVTTMVENLDKLTNPENKVFIEISQNGILPIIDDDNWLDIEDDNIDESKLKVHVLEDEFRLKSDSESETDTVDTKLNIPENLANLRTCAKDNRSKDETKLVNGYQSNTQLEDVCSEFLTFKKKPKKPITVFNCKFTCPLCHKYFISNYFLKLHVKKHINKKIECKICKQQFKSKFYLFEHKKMMHLLNNWNYCSCKTCGRTFTSENKMIEHEKCHQTKECQFCFKKFISQLHYDNHIQRHVTKLNRMKQKTIQTCSFCEKEYANDNELSVHVNKVHLEIKPYGCDMCERQFYIDSDLRNHKKLHSMRKIEKCQFCMKTLRCRKDLVIHLRKHMEIQPFKCLICPQAFYSELASKNHMKKWHGGCYCCRLCKKVFVNQKGLQRHVSRAHSVF